MTEEDDAKDDFTWIGYARVSTPDQSVQMQISALIKYGVEEKNIYHENMSGTKKDRPEFARAMRQLREGDTLVVWKLDRVARSLIHLLKILEELEKRGIAFKSITDNIDTGTIGGRLVTHIMGAIAEFERNLIAQRTQTGVDNAKAKGIRFGAKHILKPEDVPTLWVEVNEQGMTKVDAAKKYGVHVQTITRRLKQYEKEQSEKEAISLGNSCCLFCLEPSAINII